MGPAQWEAGVGACGVRGALHREETVNVVWKEGSNFKIATKEICYAGTQGDLLGGGGGDAAGPATFQPQVENSHCIMHMFTELQRVTHSSMPLQS